LREKPAMSAGHNRSMRELMYQLIPQLPRSDYELLVNAGYLRAVTGETYVPDLAIVTTQMVERLSAEPRRFEVYDAAVPFVAEFWSPHTGTYDIDTKFPAYQQRGDAEIWRVHPFERTVTIWRRQPDGAYVEEVATGGAVALHLLPRVKVAIEPQFVAE
jgi:Uma2 family endonuclease